MRKRREPVNHQLLRIKQRKRNAVKETKMELSKI
jgi:hypothetical protein